MSNAQIGLILLGITIICSIILIYLAVHFDEVRQELKDIIKRGDSNEVD